MEDKIKELKKKLSAEKKNFRELKAKAENVIRAVQPQLDFFEDVHGSWTTLFFIPEDLGFEEIEHKEKGLPTVRIYHKDGFAITRMSEGSWMIAKDGMRMSFRINNKYEGYQILKSAGVNFDVD